MTDAFAPSGAGARASRVADLVARWRTDLVGLGGLNPLLWYSTASTVQLPLTGAHPAGVAKLLAGRGVALSELVRSPGAYETARQRARAVADKARELEQERGLATCYLAVGMATWTPGPSYPAVPQAPVLLIPVRLRSNGTDPTDLRIDAAGPTEANPALLSYLAGRGIAVDGSRLVRVAQNTHGLSPDAAYALLREACASLPGFGVSPSLVLSVFPVDKLALVADLGEQAELLASHDVIAAMAGDDDAAAQVGAQAPPSDGEPPLESELLVLDADSSQQAVVDAVHAGSNLVVLGPPGTGKSQTIANLIASSAAQGKRILFVAEKRAAVDAVIGRLRARGLGDLVLDAHGVGTDQRHLATGMLATVDTVLASDHWHDPPVDSDLVRMRDRLAAHRATMHEGREPWGVSVDEAQTQVGRLSARPDPPHSRVRLHGTHLRDLSDDRRTTGRDLLIEVARDGAWLPDGPTDPWFGARVVGREQTERTRELVARLADGGLASYRETIDGLADRVGLRAPSTILEADEQLDLMSRVFSTLEIFRPEIFDAPLPELVTATRPRAERQEEGHPNLMERRRLRSQAKHLQRPGRPPADLHGVLQRAAEQKQRWRELSGPGSRPSAPVDVPAVQRVHESFREEIDWLAARLEQTDAGGDLIHADLDDLQKRLENLRDQDARLSARSATITRVDQLHRLQLGALVTELAHRKVPVDQVGAEFDFVWWSSVLAELAQRDAGYTEHDGPELRAVADRYAEADAAHLDAAVGRVRAAHTEQVRRVCTDFPDQVQLLRDVVEERGPVSVRDLLAAAPELVTTVRPCWTMSPLTVPSTVPPGLWFDVVVFDEASQVPPAQAVPAISRAEQVVVVGDPRQLPPSRFSIAGPADDEPDPVDEAPEASVLDVLAPLLPQQALTWHYRSLDERLIAFSNTQIYHGGLVTFPGTLGQDVVVLELVQGARGDGRTSTAEVNRVVSVVTQQVRRRPQESVGVIAVGREHADAVEAALRAAALTDEILAGALSPERAEPLFVKALDHVQGDERDAIVVTLGYGRDADGEVVHQFGLLGGEGGERRLNVAITRARRRMTVVSAVGPQDLVPSRLRSRGTQLLRDFLIFAADGAGTSDEPPSGGQAEDSAGRGSGRRRGVSTIGGRRRRTASAGSVVDRPMRALREQRPVPPVVDDLARRLRAKGLTVHTAHGVSALPIDLVVDDPAHPGEPLVAIETDGPVWAAMTGVRDRERLRPEQLRRLGWTVDRVWTVDVFRDPARDTARIVDLVRRASLERAEARRVEP